MAQVLLFLDQKNMEVLNAAAQPELIPEAIGPYRIVRKLGEGGIGMVFEARHTQIERGAAIKLLKREYAGTKEVLERLFNEARAAGRIDHPGIIQVLDFGQLPRGDAYLVMELLTGQSLSARLRQGPLSLLEALRVGWYSDSLPRRRLTVRRWRPWLQSWRCC